MNFSFREAVQAAGDRLFLIARDRSWSYREFQSLVDAAVGEFSGSGLRGAALVAETTPEFIARLLALFELKRPAILLHPRWSERERGDGAALLDLPLCHEGETPPQVVVFTSGSTGSPKGVALSRAALVASAEASAERLGWNEDDRWLLALPPAHVGGLSILTRCLLARKTIVLASGLEPGALWDWMEQSRVTLASLVPAQLNRLFLAHPERPVPPHLRAVLLGGGPCPSSLVQEAALRGWPVLPTYGMSETCSQIATVRPGTLPAPENGSGHPLPGIEIQTVDGDIAVKGPVVMDRYLPLDRWPSPIDDQGWLHTGDLGFLDGAGRLHITGRADTQIITGGEKVAPEEVEHHLLSCPGVKEAAVFGLPGETWGQIVAAAVVPATECPMSPDILSATLEGRLADYKIPRRYLIVKNLPQTETGKIDRRRLLEWAMRPAE